MAMSPSQTLTLNKFVASAGLCSRRKADEIIKSGDISVNGAIVKEPYFQVQSKDFITFRKKRLLTEEKMYLVVNKPAMFLTACSDKSKRKIVLDLVKGVTKNRLFHIGRLDFMTTGIILLTNDGKLAQKLSHPRYNLKKTYRIHLYKPIAHQDLHKIRKGIYLTDGFVKVDFVAASSNFKTLTIQISSGKNRVLRRIFQRLGYEIKKLDRTAFGPIYKKKLALGGWRHLSPSEVNELKKL